MRTDITNREKLAPGHATMRQDFRGDDDAYWRQLETITSSVLPIGSVHDRWKIRLKEGVSYETFGSDLSTLYHLQVLIRLMGCERVLEVGTYIGVSTLFLAEAVGPAGRVVTVEIGAEFSEIARDNFRMNRLDDRIGLINADINTLLPGWLDLGIQFDLIFLDGSKQDYGRLLRPLLAVLRPGGLLFVDNVFLHGDALNPDPVTEKGRGVRSLLEAVRALPHDKVILPCGDGHLLLVKR